MITSHRSGKDRGLSRRYAAFCMAALEPRLLLSAVAPSAMDQYMLQLINSERANPAAYAAAVGIDLNEGLPAGTISAAPKAPLAFNPFLVSSATNHSQWIFNTQDFTHFETTDGQPTSSPATGTPGFTGVTPTDRQAAAGYTFTPPWSSGENIGYQGTSGSYNEQAYILQIEQALFIDSSMPGRGHRTNLMSTGYSEIGIGELTGAMNGYNSVMITQDFAQSNPSIFLTGVVYTDTNANQFYDPGEGLGNIIITAKDASGTAYTATTWGSGGYSLAVPAGTYTVTAADPAQGFTSIVKTNVVVTTSNVEVDFIPGTGTPSSPTSPTNPTAPTNPTSPTSPVAPSAPGGSTSPHIPLIGQTAVNLAFMQEPTAVAVGAVVSPAVTVGVYNGAGQLVTADYSKVTLSIVSGPAGGTLVGSSIGQVVNGVARFSNLSFSTVGTYTLQATDGGVIADTSASFVVGDLAAHAANQQYVSQLYKDLLQRTADPGGLSNWTALLDQGQSKATVSGDLLGSREYQGLVVTGIYASYLHRNPDPGGLVSWVNLMQQGATAADIQAGILDSAEYFQNAGGTTTGFVTALYNALLQRAPDAGGLRDWTTLLNTNQATRAQVTTQIANSDEMRTTLVTTDYRTLLRRAPDAAGLAAWKQLLANGLTPAQLVGDLVTAPEYVALAGA